MEMGFGRAGNCALGSLAMTPARSPRCALRRLAAAGMAWSLALCLAGCGSIGAITGAVAGVTAGSASTNPAVGIGVGIAVQAATDAAIQTVFRNMQGAEQDRIATLAGTMAIGETRAWDIHHALPFSDERGELQVLGAIDNALASCREVMFSVVDGKPDAPSHRRFIAQMCRQSDGEWKWAVAEPAVKRWGNLQ
ncbi:lipoprotein [soil metagenome]